nr:hypothetical protein [uncultured Haemophilus sp.]
MCDQKTISLSELIDSLGIEETKKFLTLFQCSKNLDVEKFLVQKAIRFEQASAASTHLILNSKGQILAYYSLSFKEIKIEASKTLWKKLTGGLGSGNILKVFLIGQIAKNEKITDNPVRLSSILEEIYQQIYLAKRSVGGRVVVLECEDNQSLISHYQKHGFQLLQTVEDDSQLKTMFIVPKFK